MKQKPVAFNRASLWGNEISYMKEAIDTMHLSGDGPFGKKCQTFLEKKLQVSRVLLTTSCTHALEMMALLLNVGPEDEIIVPSYTFVSTANAFALRNARLVFCDVRPDTLNLDETKLEKLITKRTKAVIVVHYAGIGCEMNEILRITQKHGVTLLEDNAHGISGRYEDKALGSFGAMATLSFHETKNITCGEGGALIINDPSLIERAEIIRDKGTDRSRFFRGAVDKYTWQDIGSSYVLSDLLAAFLLGQLEKWDAIHASRREVWSYYHEQLQGWAKETGAKLPTVPAECTGSYHLYYVMTATAGEQRALIEHLKAKGVNSVFHYLPLHESSVGKKYGNFACPVTTASSERLVRLPLYGGMPLEEAERVVAGLKSFKASSVRQAA